LKKKRLEDLKKLLDKVLTEEFILIESIEVFWITGTKYKKIMEIFSENKAK